MNTHYPAEPLRTHMAHSPQDYRAAHVLFKAYAATLAFDLSFQNFDSELQHLTTVYGPPSGALLLACNHSGDPVGCAEVRILTSDCAELKTMYIQDQYRGQGLGARLLNQSIVTARGLGYTTMRLDTLPTMKSALTLYQKAGFYAPPPI